MKLTAKHNYLLLAVFAGLCIFHLFSNRPLWLDEGFVLDNIRTSSYAELFAPLKNEQAFPRIYLCLIKFVAQFWDYELRILRSFAVICMVAAFMLWQKLYRVGFPQGDKYNLAAQLSILSSYWFIYYAAEFKPYATDVLAVALVCTFLINQRKYEVTAPKWNDYVVTCFIPMLLFFSYAALFVFWIVGFNFLAIIRKNRKVIPLAVVYLIWAVLAFGAFYVTDLKHSAFRPNLINYWESYFIDTRSVGGFFATLWEGTRRISTHWFGNIKFIIRFASFVIPFFVFSVFGFGVSGLLKDKGKVYRIESLALVLFLELMVFGIWHKYPFTGARITLFIAPFVIFMILRGIQRLEKVKYVYQLFAISYCGLLAMAFVNTLYHYIKLYQLP